MRIIERIDPGSAVPPLKLEMKPPAQPYVPVVKFRRTPGASLATAAAVVLRAALRERPLLASLPVGDTYSSTVGT